MIYELYIKVTEEFIPSNMVNNNKSKNQKWMTQETARLRNNKENKWDEYRKNKTPEKYAAYARARNDSVKLNREAKMNFEMSLSEDIEKGDCKAFYAYMRSQTTIKEEVTRVVMSDGSLSNSVKETADTINLVFQSFFVVEGNDLVPEPEFRFKGEPLEDFDFTVEDIHEILTHLKEKSASGPN